jgi:hypothetical protein
VQEILHFDLDPTDFVFITLCLLSITWVLANIMTESSHCFAKWARISGGKHLHYGLPDILNGLLCSYLCPLWGTKEVIGGVTHHCYSCEGRHGLILHSDAHQVVTGLFLWHQSVSMFSAISTSKPMARFQRIAIFLVSLNGNVLWLLHHYK